MGDVKCISYCSGVQGSDIGEVKCISYCSGVQGLDIGDVKFNNIFPIVQVFKVLISEI